MTTKELNIIIFDYIVRCIDADGYELETAPETDRDKLQFLRDTFHAEYDWSIQRFGWTVAFAEWCKGLPSSFNIAFENYRIIELAKEWGTLSAGASERREQKILDNYWNLIANKTAQLLKRHGIEA